MPQEVGLVRIITFQIPRIGGYVGHHARHRSGGLPLASCAIKQRRSLPWGGEKVEEGVVPTSPTFTLAYPPHSTTLASLACLMHLTNFYMRQESCRSSVGSATTRARVSSHTSSRLLDDRIHYRSESRKQELNREHTRHEHHVPERIPLILRHLMLVTFNCLRLQYHHHFSPAPHKIPPDSTAPSHSSPDGPSRATEPPDLKPPIPLGNLLFLSALEAPPYL